ncbi:hypothetical protein [Streptomyces phytophilus]|uniref:hypothetical protein n=1 Tax=Streptomyces phytophilus TaxID=722715 RepID=UPI0015F0D561|nr:hypothetical protein [Streptomyces phytophilus]
MNDPDIDGDVYVTPRYLAGTTGIGDPALAPLLGLGWELHHDDLGNAYTAAPDRRGSPVSVLVARGDDLVGQSRGRR